MFCPLTGKPCPNPKSVEVCESVNGQPSRMNLCENCICHVEQLTGGKLLDPSALLDADQEPEPPVMPKPFMKNGRHKGNGVPTTPSPQELLTGPLAYFAKMIEQVEAHHQANPLTVPCPGCGMTLNDVHRQGHLGCQHCYVFFKRQVTPLLQHIHEGNVQHVGKTQKHHQQRVDAEAKAGEMIMIHNSLAALDKKLATAVKDERYEDAGKIRDQIKYLKTKLEG